MVRYAHWCINKKCGRKQVVFSFYERKAKPYQCKACGRSYTKEELNL